MGPFNGSASPGGELCLPAELKAFCGFPSGQPTLLQTHTQRR